MDVKVGLTSVGDGHPTFVVAEMAWSHDGSIEKAEAIIRGAGQAGADAVNFHLTSLEQYMVRSYGSGSGRVSSGHDELPVFDYLDSINLSEDAWIELAALARDLDLGVSVLCNDGASVEFAAESLDPDLYMIHPSAIAIERFVKQVAGQKRPVLLYVGGSTLGEIERAIGWARDADNERIILQHGFQSYPTAVENAQLAFLSTLSEMFDCPVAYGDHTDAESDMALVLPLLAVAMGADVIEKHITHDRSMRGEDFESALNPDEFSVLVERIRQAEEAVGEAAWRPLGERELRYREVSRKRAVAARAIDQGTRVGMDDIAFKRADAGVYPEELESILGRRAKAPLQVDEPMTRDGVE